jgi:hypothetical protein
VSTLGGERTVPFLLLGDTRRRALASAVRTRVERWRGQWAPEQKAVVRIEIPESQERDPRLQEAACFRMADARPALVIIVPARSVLQVVGVLGDAESRAFGPPHGLAEKLEHAALSALLREFRTPDVLDPSLERIAGAAAEVQHQYIVQRYTPALVTLGESQCPVLLLLSPELVGALLPAGGSPIGAERLDRRSAAVAQEVVAIEGVLGEGEVSVSELARLAVGDVIVLDQKLGDPASLAIRGGARIVDGAPGRLDERWAIQIKRGATT